MRIRSRRAPRRQDRPTRCHDTLPATTTPGGSPLRAKPGPLLRSLPAKREETTPDRQAFTTLPDQTIRPLADALIQQEAAAKIHPHSCHNIQRMAEALSPLEPREAGRILGVMFDIATESEKIVSLIGDKPGRP